MSLHLLLASATGLLSFALGACGAGDQDEDSTAEDTTAEDTTAEIAPVDPGATLAWSAPVEEDWSVTDAVAVDGLVVVATKWSLEEESAVLGFDAQGNQVWRAPAGYGTIELAVLPDGSVRACDDLGGDILVADSGAQVRDATDDECPEDFEGRDTTVEVTDLPIAVEDADAEAWLVDGAVVTFSPSSGLLHLYR